MEKLKTQSVRVQHKPLNQHVILLISSVTQRDKTPGACNELTELNEQQKTCVVFVLLIGDQDSMDLRPIMGIKYGWSGTGLEHLLKRSRAKEH